MIDERPLTGEEREELREATTSVDLPDLEALAGLLEAVAEGEVAPDDELTFRLGAWWGQQVRAATGWKWVHLRLGEGLEAPALVDGDRSVALLPLQLVATALEGEGPDLVRILERLRRGDRPTGAPGTYALVG